jgi:hypothetical protein
MVINGYTENAVVKTRYIYSVHTPSAAFTTEEYEINNNFRFTPLDEITNSQSYYYIWNYEKLGDGDVRSDTVIINYENQSDAIGLATLDTGAYQVTLIIEDTTYGCSSVFSDLVYVSPEIQIPNIFFPDVEEFFIIDPQNPNTILEFRVFNRYGLQVFTQTAPIINWPGKTNTGLLLHTGVYYYTLESVSGDPIQKYNQQGFIHLYR